MGLSMNNEIILYIATCICGVVGWMANSIKGSHEKRMNIMEAKYECNAERIEKIKDRVSTLEHTTVKRNELDYILGSWQEEVKDDIDKSFIRVHQRIDELYSLGKDKVVNETTNSDQAAPAPVKKHSHDR